MEEGIFMYKYRKKPVEVEAVQFDGKTESIEWISQQLSVDARLLKSSERLIIETSKGIKKVAIGDYIIKDINGELNTCKPDIFQKTYEKIEDDDLLNEKPIFFEDLKNGYTKAYTKSDIDMLIKYNNSMELVINKLELLNPLNVLKKGYSVTKINDKPLKTIKDVKAKDKLNIKIIDGEIDAIVEGVK